MSQIQTTIIDRAAGTPVAAVLHDELSTEAVNEVEDQWAGRRIEAARRLHAGGEQVPDHWHWDWRRMSTKLRLLAYRCIGIECANEMQGLMMVSMTRFAQLEPDVGKPIVYIDYMETAPWNVRLIVDEVRYAGVGIRLIEAAVRFSIEEGYKGRVGLHALPQAERFYRDVCEMVLVGPDEKCDGLTYFEFRPDGALAFLSEETHA